MKCNQNINTQMNNEWREKSIIYGGNIFIGLWKISFNVFYANRGRVECIFASLSKIRWKYNIFYNSIKCLLVKLNLKTNKTLAPFQNIIYHAYISFRSISLGCCCCFYTIHCYKPFELYDDLQ